MNGKWKRMGRGALGAVLLMGLGGCEGDGGDDRGGDNPHQGSYSGTYSGGYAGTWRATIHGNDTITGTAHNTAEGLNYSMRGTVTDTGEIAALVGTGESGAAWSARVDAAGNVTGTWRQEWSGLGGRIAGARQ
ncbi:MAG: hypothetical protein K9N49_06375 [Candidatus Marinimicrobia bacterium]|nr:hypothetical protein [Candidatus Neomarinimicrobiota bacterium]